MEFQRPVRQRGHAVYFVFPFTNKAIVKENHKMVKGYIFEKKGKLISLEKFC